MCRKMESNLLSTSHRSDPVPHKSPWRSGMVSSAWRLSRRLLSLHDVPPQRFARCQWQTSSHPSTLYLIYRSLLVIFLASTAIASFAGQEVVYPADYTGTRVQLNYFKWFIYLTNWGFMLCLLQAALALLVLLVSRTHRSLSISCESGGSECSEEPCSGSERQSSRTPLLCRAYWVACTVATDLAFVISLVYWTLVHDPKLHRVNALNVLVHGCNSLVMVTEVLVTSHPVRPLHALYTIAFGTAYGAFSALYFLAGGTDRRGESAIYPSLDWRAPASAFGFVAVCACAMCAAHALATLLAAARVRIAHLCLVSRAARQSPHLDKLSALEAVE